MERSLGSKWDAHIAPCVHEAGHAVIAHVLGARVIGMIVNHDGSGESKIETAEPRAEVHIRLAGYIAELRYCESVGDCPSDRHPSLSRSDDNERAWVAAQEACAGDLSAASALLNEARGTVTTTVTEEWARIERIALALSGTGRLTSGPLSDIFNPDV